MIASTRRRLMEKSIPASSSVPAKRSLSPIGVTATFAPASMIGRRGDSDGRAKVMLYPLAGWIGSRSPSAAASPGVHEPVARTTCRGAKTPRVVRTAAS